LKTQGVNVIKKFLGKFTHSFWKARQFQVNGVMPFYSTEAIQLRE